MSRAAVLGLLFACAGCDVVLGIHDVPQQVDGATDAPHVCSDAAVEDCTNGFDDNCDGLVDCADPRCQSAGFECTAPAPAGFSGPVAFGTAQGATIPACSGLWSGTGAEGHNGMQVAAPAQCGCSCPSKPVGTSCNNLTTLDVWSSTGCPTVTPQQTVLTAGVCSDTATGLSAAAFNDPPTSEGSCAAVPSKVVPEIAWTTAYAVCRYTPFAGGGCNGALCVAKPAAPYGPKPCVYAAGDVACPAAVYTVKTRVTSAVSDGRDCTACNCSASGGSCASSLSGWTLSGCAGASQAIATTNSCASYASLASAQAGAPVATAGACSPSGGQATGSVSETGFVTVCCPL